MNILVEWFRLDPNQFNEVALNFGEKSLAQIWTMALVFIPLALWFFWTSLKRIQSKFRKTFLMSLRALTFIVLLFILLKPELEFKKSHILKNSIAILIDDTKSMSIKTFPLEIPRIDFVRQSLEKNHETLMLLRNDFKLDYYFMSNQIEPISVAEIKESYQPKKSITDFLSVFSQLKKNIKISLYRELSCFQMGQI